MRSPFLFAAATSLIAVSAPVFAADSSEAEASTAAASAAEDGEEVVVQGERTSYGIKSTSTATKTSTDIKDIPQALTVITEGQIEDQALRSVGELLLFVPGATPATGEGNRDQITLRGNNTTADFFRDGVRDDVQYFRDFYNVDRVEVLKGPNAMIFGRGGGGGIVNRVTKRSTQAQIRDFAILGDSEGGVRLTGDLDQPFGNGVGLRVNGLYENGESFRRHVDLERYAVNPTAGILAGPDTRIDLSYEYFHDRRTADRGVPSDSDGNPLTVDEPLEGFDRTFFGDPDDSFARADVHIATLAAEHRFNEDLTLRNRTLYGDYDKFYQNIFPNGPATPAGTVVLGAYNDTTKRRNLFSQTDLIWESRLGGIDQTLLVGFEVGGSKGRNQRRNGVFSGSSTVFLTDPTVDASVSFTGGGANNRIKTRVAAAYIQDQIRFTDWLELVAGLRFDRFSIDVDNLNTGVELDRTDQLWSPRLGLIVKPTRNLSLYASYSRSYLPQSGDQFNSLDVTAEALKPERFDNYEFGAKWEPVEGLLATAAIYQLDRANTRAPVSGGVVLLSGEQRSRGIELGLERSVTDEWQISAGYAWQKAEVTEPTQACPSGECEVPLVPRHSFSLWSRYDVSDRLGLGLGVVARTKSYASINNMVKLPGYARVDAAVFYTLTREIEAQLNVENLFDADYFPTAHNDNNIAPGAPLTVKGALRFGF
jgi:catecholate siderophore receptor